MSPTADAPPIESEDADTAGQDPPSTTRHNGSYHLGLLVAAVLGTMIRVSNILYWQPTCDGDLFEIVESGQAGARSPASGCFAIWGDSLYGYVQGRMIGRGEMFIGSADWYVSGGHRLVPSAGDPPLYALFLGFFARLGLTSGTALRLVSAGAGVAGVVLIGMVARRVAGRRAGVIAALVAAVCPLLWINDGMLLSEALYVPLIAASMLAGYRFWNRPTYGAAALLGFVIALAALTRAEALLLLGFMVVPLAWGLRRRGVTLRRQVILVVVSGVVGLATISPWLVYNLARFEEPVFMTSGTGAVLLAGSCDPAFYGEFMGYYGANCYDEYIRSGAVLGDPRLPRCDQSAVDAAQTDPLDRSREQLDQVARCYPDPLTMDESQRDKISRDLAVKYIEGHRRQLPVVMAARVGRAWDAYVPLQNTRLDVDVEGRGRVASWAGLWFYYAELPFAIYGAVLLWRRRIPLSPLLSMAGVITVTAAITFGVTRYRVPVDVMIAVLAAVGIDALLRLIRPRSTEEDSDMTRREPKDGPGQTVAATGARTTTTTSTAEASSATAGAVMSGAGERGGE